MKAGRVLAIVCPGQGAQKPGFLAPWLELPGATERLAALSEAAESDLAAHGTTSDEATIKDTAVAQPLIVAAGLLAAPALVDSAETTPDAAFAQVVARAGAVSGHSVGEFTAAALGGVLSAGDAMVLVRERGRAMAAASAVRPTGMSAVLGGDPDEVAAALETHGLTPANMNGGGQVVAAGTSEQLEALAAQPPAKARVMPLAVAGAFHTTHMEPAVEVLERRAGEVSAATSGAPFVSNRDGEAVTDGGDILRRLVEQVRRPVRWDRCMETLAALGVTGLIEVPPAGTLVGLAKRGLKGVETLALKSPDDLDAARRMLDEHGA